MLFLGFKLVVLKRSKQFSLLKSHYHRIDLHDTIKIEQVYHDPYLKNLYIASM